MSDERPDSLAAQAASWVPPWERPPRPPDPAYPAAAGEPESVHAASEDSSDPARAGSPGEPESVHAASEDSSDPARAGSPGESAEDGEVAVELEPLPGEGGAEATVDAPQELPGQQPPAPTDVGVGPELPLPAPIEEAVEEADEAPDAGTGEPVDAPLPADGDDAGEVFDAAAGDDVSDDSEADLPFRAQVPAADEPDALVAASAEAVTTPAGVPGGAAIPAQGRGTVDPAGAVGAPARRTEKDLDEGELRAALEAILLVVDEPVGEMQLAQIMEQPTERVAAVLEDISARYTAAGHGFDLRRAAGGWRLYTRPEYAAYVERFVLDGQSVRLTQAALETLAVVAYKQPVTRSRISAIRGVNCDGVMRTLATRGLIAECGTEPETGAFLYRTTGLFLEKLGLNSVDELPSLAPFLPDDVEEVLDASG